jgi:hypothetical protein
MRSAKVAIGDGNGRGFDWQPGRGFPNPPKMGRCKPF